MFSKVYIGYSEVAMGKNEENWKVNYEALIQWTLEHGHFPNRAKLEGRWLLNWYEYNAKLQKWVRENSEKILGGTCSIGNSEIVTPSLQVNRFYILLHAYNHLTGEGLGFRQLMDYFFVLRSEVVADDERKELNQLFGSFGMKRFAGAVMWIMQAVFGLEEKYMVCAPNESEGRFVLNEVLLGGNFGHHDERKKKIGKGKWVSVMSGLQHSIRLFGHYPSNTIWLPIWLVYHFLWKRLKRI